MAEPTVTKRCGYSGLGLVGDLSGLPTEAVFAARCTCGAAVTVSHGRISEHYVGVDEDSVDESSEPQT